MREGEVNVTFRLVLHIIVSNVHPELRLVVTIILSFPQSPLLFSMVTELIGMHTNNPRIPFSLQLLQYS